MAAIRSALAMLGRRSCGSSGSSTAASIGRRGLEIHQVLRLAAPRAPLLPSLRPAGRNLEVRKHHISGACYFSWSNKVVIFAYV
jgi:hypothetical protein